MNLIDKEYFVINDLKINEGILLPKENIYLTSCHIKALIDLTSKSCNGSADRVYEEIENLINYFELGMWKAVNRLFHVITMLAILYLILDLIERWVYIYTCVSSHTHVYDMMMSVLSKKVPGSYTRKQLNVLSYFALFLYYMYPYLEAYLSEMYNITRDMFFEVLTYFLIISMIFRFVMHIHSLRLLPGIGHFVITTFMMGTNLMQFSVIYGIVLFIFSVIFHILIDDPNCPLKKYDGFGSILSSMFATFKLTFGHGDFDAYYTTTSVMLTYTIFVIMSGLLFMNLIIAIMSTTATSIMADPWKDTLWRMEWLDEALSVEYTLSVLTLPFSRCCHCGYWSHKRAGYVVRQDEEDGKHRYKVFIEIFQCPALV